MRRPKQTYVIMTACLMVLLGELWSRFVHGLDGRIIWAELAIVIVSFKRLRLVGVYSLIFLGFSLGWWRGGILMSQVQQNKALANHKVTIQALAGSDGVYDLRKQLTFDVSHAVVQGANEPLVGNIAVAGFGVSNVQIGDHVTATGKLYPTRGSHTYSISYANITVRPSAQPAIQQLKRHFNASLYSVLPEPHASFAIGLIIGQRSSIAKDLSDKLNTVGLTHIVAVSGYNLTILILAARRLLGNRSKFQSTAIALALILGFVAVTGLSASIVRAAIISSLSLAAGYYGRQIKPMMLILFTAALTVLWNPFYLWSDVGWYLSFLAFFGILVLAPQIHRRLFGGVKPKLISGLVIETLSAQVMTLPFIIFIFGRLSLVGLITNVLIVPLLPVAMLSSFIAGIFGMLLPTLGLWLAVPAKLILTYMVDLIQLFARTPHALITVNASIIETIILYVVIGLFTLTMWRKNSKKRMITDADNFNESLVELL